MKILVSACLLGENCKYNGGNNFCQKVADFVKDHEVAAVCPEVMGGLPVPRVPAEIVKGKVMTRDGRSVDAEFRKGADLALKQALMFQPDLVILKSGSPSCSIRERYDGTFSGKKIPGMGVFGTLAAEYGFHVTDEENIE